MAICPFKGGGAGGGGELWSDGCLGFEPRVVRSQGLKHLATWIESAE
jgi:hypothetical protein